MINNNKNKVFCHRYVIFAKIFYKGMCNSNYELSVKVIF